MKILGPTETGKGILIEMDAGYVSPSHEFNKKMLDPNYITTPSDLKKIEEIQKKRKGG